MSSYLDHFLLLRAAFDVQPAVAEFRHPAWNVVPIRLQHRRTEPACPGDALLSFRAFRSTQ